MDSRLRGNDIAGGALGEVSIKKTKLTYEGKNMIKRIEVIFSDNAIIKDVLSDFLIVTDLNLYSKIDLLIIDKYLSDEAIKKLTKISDRIINLTDYLTIENAATLVKPFRLHKLLEIVDNYRKNESIFCLINDAILYSQRSGYIYHLDKKIKLNDKENELFSALLMAPNYVMPKEDLLSRVWGYAKDAETYTLDTHLARLRAYFSAGFINNKDGFISLDIHQIM